MPGIFIVYKPLAIPLGVEPGFQALAFNVVVEAIATGPLQIVDDSVGSLPSMVKRTVAPPVEQVIVTF